MSNYNAVENLINNSLKNEVNNKSLIKLYFEIGRILQNNKDIYSLSLHLKSIYGVVIGFTPRNLKNMILFYSSYKDVDFKLLENVAWKNHLEILKVHDKLKLLNICNEYNLDKDQLLKYIKNEYVLSYNHYKNNDEMLIELKKLKNSLATK